MADRPILFSGPMVRALLEGRKSQTRRLVNPQPIGSMVWDGGWRDDQWYERDDADIDAAGVIRCPYGQPGDRLWVRETWALEDCGADGERVVFAADRAAAWVLDGPTRLDELHYLESAYAPDRWRPSIHMPRWASRLMLEVTAVRVQRLQDISEEDARAEGIAQQQVGSLGAPEWGASADAALWRPDPVSAFRALWDSINGAGSWESNSWVWAVSFKVVP